MILKLKINGLIMDLKQSQDKIKKTEECHGRFLVIKTTKIRKVVLLTHRIISIFHLRILKALIIEVMQDQSVMNEDISSNYSRNDSSTFLHKCSIAIFSLFSFFLVNILSPDLQFYGVCCKFSLSWLSIPLYSSQSRICTEISNQNVKKLHWTYNP